MYEIDHLIVKELHSVANKYMYIADVVWKPFMMNEFRWDLCMVTMHLSQNFMRNLGYNFSKELNRKNGGGMHKKKWENEKASLSLRKIYLVNFSEWNINFLRNLKFKRLNFTFNCELSFFALAFTQFYWSYINLLIINYI